MILNLWVLVCPILKTTKIKVCPGQIAEIIGQKAIEAAAHLTEVQGKAEWKTLEIKDW